MKDLWDRLEAHAKKSGRSLRLRPGTTEAAIATAEETIGLAFPPDLRASLLVHDGQDGDEDDEDAPFPFLPGCSPMRSLDAIVDQWKDEQGFLDDSPPVDHTPEILSPMRHSRRIPIAGNRWWDGDNTYVDLFPAAAGTVGQVITFTSECDMSVMGPSLRGALENVLAALDAGGHPTASVPRGNTSYRFAEWVASQGRHHDENSGKHAPFPTAVE